MHHKCSGGGTHGLNHLQSGAILLRLRERIAPAGGAPGTKLLQELHSLATTASHACLGSLNSSLFHRGCVENQFPH